MVIGTKRRWFSVKKKQGLFEGLFSLSDNIASPVSTLKRAKAIQKKSEMQFKKR